MSSNKIKNRMNGKLWIFLVLAIALPFAAGVASAHHGTASFDTGKVTVLKGTVTAFLWTNPHGEIDFNVKNSKGSVEEWQGSLTSPNWLARDGWTRNTLKAGDQITLSGHQSKNHPYALWITKIQLANGQELPVHGVENLQ